MSDAPPTRRRTRLFQVWAVLAVLFAGAVAASLLVGEGDLSDPSKRDTYLRLRSLRLLNSMLAGSALAAGGVLVQGLFRNPLASPSILGTSAGASLGGMLVLLLWNALLAGALPSWLPTEMALPIGCVLGAMGSLALLLAVTRRTTSMVAVLLTGFILSSLFLAFGSLITSVAQDTWELGRAVVAFTLGGVDAKGAVHAAFALPLVLVGAVVALGWSTHLDALLSGEEEAASLGVDVPTVRRWTIVWTAVLTGAAVAIGGNLTFVGLVVPHALRPFVGVSHRRLFPAAIAGGAIFVALADVAVRILPVQGSVPLGVVTGLVGAPVFLVLLARSSARGELN